VFVFFRDRADVKSIICFLLEGVQGTENDRHNPKSIFVLFLVVASSSCDIIHNGIKTI